MGNVKHKCSIYWFVSRSEHTHAHTAWDRNDIVSANHYLIEWRFSHVFVHTRPASIDGFRWFWRKKHAHWKSEKESSMTVVAVPFVALLSFYFPFVWIMANNQWNTMLLHIAHYNAYDIDLIRNLVHTIAATLDADVSVCACMMENRATIMPMDPTLLPYTLEINSYSINWCRDLSIRGSFDCILSTWNLFTVSLSLLVLLISRWQTELHTTHTHTHTCTVFSLFGACMLSRCSMQ